MDAVPQLQVLLLHCLFGCGDCCSLQPSPSNCGQLLQPILQQFVVSFRKVYLRHSITCRLLQPDLTVLSLATYIVHIGLLTIFIITLTLSVSGSLLPPRPVLLQLTAQQRLVLHPTCLQL